ncbi:MAG: hypothetical protein F6K17_16105 [Okeania sp. SIO3C4]|nr:hypothetical protein [Okeania sp. SIO3C4]
MGDRAINIDILDRETEFNSTNHNKYKYLLKFDDFHILHFVVRNVG